MKQLYKNIILFLEKKRILKLDILLKFSFNHQTCNLCIFFDHNYSRG